MKWKTLEHCFYNTDFDGNEEINWKGRLAQKLGWVPPPMYLQTGRGCAGFFIPDGPGVRCDAADNEGLEIPKHLSDIVDEVLGIPDPTKT